MIKEQKKDSLSMPFMTKLLYYGTLILLILGGIGGYKVYQSYEKKEQLKELAVEAARKYVSGNSIVVKKTMNTSLSYLDEEGYLGNFDASCIENSYVAIKSNDEYQPVISCGTSKKTRSSEVSTYGIYEGILTYGVSVSPNDYTNQDITVTITASEPVREIEGWTRSDDHKVLTKMITENTEINLTLVSEASENKVADVSFVVNNIDREAPKVEVRYSKTSLTNEDVTVTLVGNKRLRHIEGWNLSEDSFILTKTYTSNTVEDVNVLDLAGNVTPVHIDIKNIDKEKPQLTVEKSVYTITNGNVVVTITSNEMVDRVDGWDLSSDRLTLTKTYSSNAEETVSVRDLAGNTEQVQIKIDNIDREAPMATATYSTRELTKDPVVVTITSTKAMQEIEGWTLAPDKMSMTKSYDKNAKEIVFIKDQSGNIGSVAIEIVNIDTTAPTVEASYDMTEPTVGSVTVTLTSNKELRALEGWTLSSNKMSMTKTYNENIDTVVTVTDLAGNTKDVPVVISNIDHEAPQTTVSYNPNTWTNKDITVTITSNEKILETSGWTLSKDKMSMTKTYTENTKETIEVKDLAGNKTSTMIDVKHIDRKAPNVRVSYNTDSKTRDDITVTITADKKLREMEGWTLSSDKHSLSKTYKENTTETVTVKDLAGNTADAKINVTQIDREGPKTSVSYSETEATNKDVTVTITSNEPMMEVSGWDLSKDKLSLSRKYGRNVNTTITVSDELGNTSDVKVEINNIDKTAPTLTVDYSETGATNKDVTVTITSNKPLQKLEGWDLSDDKLSMTKTYKENANETITVSDKLGNKAEANVVISNIDKTPAKIEVSYSPDGKTNGDVTVTLTSDKPLQKLEGWDLSDDELSMTKTFTDPIDETIIIKDTLGNETEVKVTVDQIDREAPEVKISYDIVEPTKDDVTATITSNEPMKELEGWTLSEDKLSMSKTYRSNVKGTITVSDLAGNESKVKVLIENIDKTAPQTTVSYSPKSWTNKDVTVTITSDEPMMEIEGWTLASDKMSMTKVYSQNVKGTIAVKDLVGNKTNTVVSINFIDKTAPKVEVSYNPDTKTRDDVTVTITANKKLREMEGWTRSSDKRSLSKVYKENTSETITVTDIAGNHTDAKVHVTQIDREGPKANVSYSETEATNKDVTVTITSDEPMKELAGWDLSEDKLSMTKNYTENVTETITVSDELGNTSEVSISIKNIDKEGPKTSVSYSELEATNKDITVTITSDEPMKKLEGWNLSEDKLSMTKKYTENVTETVTVSDELGNTSEVSISINNIDKTPAKVTVSYNPDTKTTRDVVVTLTSDKPMQVIDGWTRSSDRKSMTKTYTENMKETVVVKDRVGNETEVNIHVTQIDREGPKTNVSYSETEATNKDVTVTITSDEPMKKLEGWDLSEDKLSMSKDYAENVTETITVSDELGNTSEVSISIKNIDKEGPKTSVSYSETEATNKDVTVTITSDEPMKKLEGWDLSEDKLTMTKKYAENVTETITVSDELGNTGEVSISINNIDKEGPKTSVSYSETNATNKGVTVTITSDEPMKEVSGWTLSEDKLSMTKKYDENVTETVTVSDELGNTSEVSISIKNIDKTPAKVTVSYNPDTKTTGDVVVTLTSDKAMQEIDGWTRSSDRKSMTKTYTENMKETVIVKDHVGNKTEVLVHVTQIDREGPKTSVSYSELEATNKDITVTITSNEAMKELEGWDLSDDKLSMTKKYTENVTETVTVSDELGNISEVSISINNIDKEGPKTTVSYSKTSPTNKGVTVTITSDEPMKEISGWTLSEDKLSMTKKYAENVTETVTVSDELGNTSEVAISIKNIDKTPAKVTVSYNPDTKTSGDVVVTLTSDKAMQEILGWTRSSDRKSMTKTYTENMKETIVVKDHVGNKTEVNVHVTQIDREGPKTSVSYSETEATNKDVTVTITSDEPMKEISGWDLSEDKLSMTKKYTENVTETVTVSDDLGNTSEVAISINNIDREGPKTSVSYSELEATNKDITVTITSDEAMKELSGWTLSSDKLSMTKKYAENVTETVTVSDELGNTSEVSISINNIDKTPAKVTVSYSPDTKTTGTVTVTLTSDKAMKEIDGWTRSEDHKSMTKTYTENMKETVIVKDHVGNKTEVNVHVTQIDHDAPEIEVSYSTTESTKDKVIVTITSNEPMNELEGWDLSEDKLSMSKEYTDNIEETVTVSDLAGNTKDVTISIDNIDRIAPSLDVQYSTTTLTSDDVVVTITSNKKVQPVTGWTLSSDQKVLTKTYTSNITEVVRVQDLLGNGALATIEINNIDKDAPVAEVTYNPNKPTKDNVIVTVTSNEPVREVEGWTRSKDKKTLTKEYTENLTETITLIDAVGNQADVVVTVNQIDRTKPQLSVDYSTDVPTQQPIMVTITSDKPMKEVEGWTLSSDKLSMSKEFDSNVDEVITVSDLAGNTSDIHVQISNIDKDAPVTNVSYSTKALTNGTVTATITSNEEMQPVAGWTLASDKMSMTKTYENSMTEYVLVKDLAGNTTPTKVTISNIDKIAPELSIEYDNTAWTKDNVTATIYSNKKLQEVEGWILSKDKRSLTKSYGTNINEKVNVKDIAGNVSTITVNITNIDKTAPVITVIDGEQRYTADFIKQVEVSKTEEFTNLEATATDDEDTKIQVKVSGKVDRAVLGTYPVVYEAVDHVGHKTVVTASIEVVDSQAPVITLNGDEFVTLGLGSKYTDQGATAVDNYDSSVNVSSTNNINNFQIGTYEVTYTSTDASGNTATAVRTVSVIPGSASDLTRNINNCSTTGECYNKDATDNYVWYSGYLWRILKVNSDNTVKLVTEDSIAGFSYDDNSSSFKGSNAEDWLLNVFYPSLNNASTIVTSGQYCNQPLLSTTAIRYSCSSNNTVTSRVGLLTMDEYNILGAERSFLNNGDHFFTMTPSQEGYIWVVQFDGTKKYTFSVTNPYAMRPVITLHANVKVRTGNGTKANPFRLENDYSANPNTTLNTRKTGEYVRFANKNWRIVSTGSTTKLVLDANYITNGTYAKMTFGDSATFSLTKGIGQYLNTTVYNNLFSTTDKEYLTPTNYYFSSYRLGNNPRTTSLTASGTKVNAYVGLNNVGELMSGSSNTSRTPNFTSWLLNYNSYNNNVWFTSSAGTSEYSSISDVRGVRPTITLKSTVRITSGNGTSTSPYVIAY